jgi:hypothetical protein
LRLLLRVPTMRKRILEFASLANVAKPKSFCPEEQTM